LPLVEPVRGHRLTVTDRCPLDRSPRTSLDKSAECAGRASPLTAPVPRPELARSSPQRYGGPDQSVGGRAPRAADRLSARRFPAAAHRSGRTGRSGRSPRERCRPHCVAQACGAAEGRRPQIGPWDLRRSCGLPRTGLTQLPSSGLDFRHSISARSSEEQIAALAELAVHLHKAIGLCPAWRAGGSLRLTEHPVGRCRFRRRRRRPGAGRGGRACSAGELCEP
jgi:hypothetical protein